MFKMNNLTQLKPVKLTKSNNQYPYLEIVHSIRLEFFKNIPERLSLCQRLHHPMQKTL